MKTIAIDIRPLLAGVGGVPEYTRHMITHMVQNHQEYTYVFFLNSYRMLIDDPLPYGSHITRVFFQCPSKLFNASIACFGVPHIDALIGRRIKKRIDLFFAPNIDFFSFLEKIPIVMTIHDVTFDLYPECFSPKQRVWHALVHPHFLIRSATRCIAVSEHTKQDVVRTYGAPAEKIHVVPLGIDPVFFQKVSSVQHHQTDMPKKYILALGARDARKNAIQIIYAYARAQIEAPRMREWTLVILGNVRPHPSLLTAVKTCGVSHTVVFLDPVSSNDRHTLFSGARVFVYPSIYEGFGLPPIEAMACGVPVIIAANSALSEMSGYGAYCVDPYHIASLSRALISCTLDERVRAYYIERGRQCAQKFSWDISAKKTVELFDQLLV